MEGIRVAQLDSLGENGDMTPKDYWRIAWRAARDLERWAKEGRITNWSSNTVEWTRNHAPAYLIRAIKERSRK